MFAEGSAGGRQMVHQFAGRRFVPRRESLSRPVNAMMADTQRSRWRMSKKLVKPCLISCSSSRSLFYMRRFLVWREDSRRHSEEAGSFRHLNHHQPQPNQYHPDRQSISSQPLDRRSHHLTRLNYHTPSGRSEWRQRSRF